MKPSALFPLALTAGSRTYGKGDGEKSGGER